MITVHEALDALFALVSPLGSEDVPLRSAAGRVLARDVYATRNQPPFAASAMDGYALDRRDAWLGATLTVIGEAAAGHRFDGTVQRGQAVRIFTGAPLPAGTDHIEIQEDVARNGASITLNDPGAPGAYVRPAGGDFRAGDAVTAPRRLSPQDIALLAAMSIGTIPVGRRPSVALIATGDELVMPGERPKPDQIIASNTLGLDAMLCAAGAAPRLLPIAKDNSGSLASAFRLARTADLIVTVGGASVGDHDLVATVAGTVGMEQSFYKVAMRPGKPLMAGRLGGIPMIGLPGNPVSAMVCGEIFLRPVIDAMLGLPPTERPRFLAPLAHDIQENGPREHYMRAQMEDGTLSVFNRQDSALLGVLAQANALAIRPPKDPARKKGHVLPFVPLG